MGVHSWAKLKFNTDVSMSQATPQMTRNSNTLPVVKFSWKTSQAFPEVTSIVAKSKTKVLSYLITIGMMKISVEGENLSRVRWLILAAVAAAVVLLNFILRKATFFNSDKVQ